MAFSIGELFFDIRARKDKFVADLRGAQDEARKSGTLIERTNKRMEESFARVDRRVQSLNRVLGGIARFVGAFAAIGAAAFAAAKAIDEVISRSQTLAMERSERAIAGNQFLRPDRERREAAQIANVADPIQRFGMEQRARLTSRLTALGEDEDKANVKGMLGLSATMIDHIEEAFRIVAFGANPLASSDGPLFSERQRARTQESFQQVREQLINVSGDTRDQELQALLRQLFEGVNQLFNQEQAEAILGRRLEEIKEALKENTRAVE